MGRPEDFGAGIPAAASFLEERLGRPALGVVLGSGFDALIGAFETEKSVEAGAVPGLPRRPGCGPRRFVSARAGDSRAWLVDGRPHLYQGFSPAEIVFPIAVLAKAGARAVLLTCAAGGLLEEDRPGDLAVVVDHINLSGCDATSAIPFHRRDPQFLDLQGVYDPALAEAWRGAAREAGVALRDGVLASVRGPCYETPAEVRMLRAMGADLVSMSTAVEAIAARYAGLRVAAVACIANRGAGLASGAPIRHGDVVGEVSEAVAGARTMLRGLVERLSARA